MMKLTVSSKMLSINNHSDENRKFDISASVNYNADGAATSFSGGYVVADKKQVATFRKDMGNTNLSVDFFSSDADQMGVILTEIHAFIAAAQEGGEA